ncbi:MAG: hypothetical protein IJ160_01735 [Muribaculaceae bacterium]|nr:hypothetical protein [Muribaculaceae bacterium]
MIQWTLRWLRNIAIFFFVSTIIMVVALKYVPVYVTPLMLTRCVEQMMDGEAPTLKHQWVPLTQISHNAPQAVMASEGVIEVLLDYPLLGPALTQEFKNLLNLNDGYWKYKPIDHNL